jgi:hypothetical protein
MCSPRVESDTERRERHPVSSRKCGPTKNTSLQLREGEL